MTEQMLRRSNWPAAPEAVRRPASETQPPGKLEDPLAELERIVMRGDPFAEARRPPPVATVEPFPVRREPVFDRAPAPAPAPQPAADDNPFGIDEHAFDAALRGTFDATPAPAAPAFAARPPVAPAPVATPVMPAPASAPAPAPTAAAQGDIDRAFLSALDRELFGSSQPASPAAARYEDFVDTADAGPVYDTAAPLPSAADPEEPAAPKRGKGVLTVAAVVGLVVVGAASAVAYTVVTGGARQATGEPPVVRADNRPTRIVAEQTAPAAEPNKIIYDRLGNQQAAASTERLVAREEQPVTNLDQAPRPEPRVVLPGGVPTAVPEPRRVTTTTIRVRPDGTLESEPTRAPTGAPARPPQPAQTMTPAAPSTVQIPPAPPAAAPAQPQAPGALALQSAEPARAPQTALTPPPPLPLPRPDTTGTVQIAQAPAAPVQVAAAPPATARTPAPPVPAASGPAQGGPFVQVTSQPTEDAARSAYTNLQRRFPQLLGDKAANIRSFEIPNRGTFWRVRVGGFASRDAANQFCTQLKQAGGDCVLAAN